MTLLLTLAVVGVLVAWWTFDTFWQRLAGVAIIWTGVVVVAALSLLWVPA